MAESDQVRRALVQKLESLHRSGVRAIPRPTLAPMVESEPAKSETIPTKSTTRPSAATPAPSPSPGSSSPTPRTPSFPATTSPLVPNAGSFTGPPVAAAERAGLLQVLAEEVSNCTLCEDLAQKRTQTVFGVGNPNAKLVFFGEAPGADEDRIGEPFVGKAGQLLTKIIEACQLKREDVYILNVLKCRPPANRNPTPKEATNCRPFFEKQLEIIRPEMICCLGSIAATTLLDTTISVGRLRGKFHEWRGIPVAVTYHPSYLLRNPAAKKMTWTDMKSIMKHMGVEL